MHKNSLFTSLAVCGKLWEISSSLGVIVREMCFPDVLALYFISLGLKIYILREIKWFQLVQ